MKNPPARPLDYRNVNSLWGSVLAETLARLGLRHAVISPGSRSTPLTLALARLKGVESRAVLDERSAAFFALGLARRTCRPVALVCTSGTAGANYFPAVIEAQESGVPLLVITADRPPEMRACRSGQTIDQQQLFGGHVNFYHELAVPAAEEGRLRHLRQMVAHAWERTRWPMAGPVHLNAPFRDPLAPTPDGTTAGLAGRFAEAKFFAGLAETSGPQAGLDARDLGRALHSHRFSRGLIIAGPAQPANPESYARAVGGLAGRLGWPVLADGLSPLRNRARLGRHLVTTYDIVARSESWRKELRPEVVLCLNDWPTSKALREWMRDADPRVVLLSPQVQNPDSLHGRTTWLHGGIEQLAGWMPVSGRRDRAWLRAWLERDRGLRRKLAGELRRLDWLFEGRASFLLPAVLPRATRVFVANSMPVRDVEYFWPANDRGHALYFNRGANGIDGTLSTALGVADGGGPAVLLTGDLALLHDSNGFLLARRFRGSLTVVLVNNNGGGIFEHLPVAGFEPPFERFFATPQDADFGKICAAHGVPHVRVRSWSHFSRLLGGPARRGVRVLELRTDRKRDAAHRLALFSRLAGGRPAP